MYNCVWYFLFIVNLSWIFFCLVYNCITFFVTQVLYFFDTYCHIVVVINRKLIINLDILKNVLSLNQPNHTLYTAPHCTCDYKIEVQCKPYGDGFCQTASQSTVLKMTKNYTEHPNTT